MASYLSYFTSNSSSAPTQQQYSQTQPVASTWTSTFSARINTLRKALTKDSEEDDPGDEDCSRVSEVLRAYYTQKGLPFPEWLPPDPRKPPPMPPAQPSYGQYGNAYGNPYAQTSHSRGPSGSGGGSGGLSDLWDSAPTQRPAALSLRAPRPTPQSMRSYDSSGRSTPNDPYSAQNLQPTSGARPLPSQRAGTMQNTSAAAPAASKSDRLRAKLGTSGRNSPAQNQPSQGSYNDSGYSGGQSAGGGNGSYTSASQSRTGGGGYDDYSSAGNHGYNDPSYRQRSGGRR